MGSRSGWVDVLRGWAALSVILLHVNIRVAFSDTALGKWLPRQVYNVVFRSGFHGVRVFFVISGFLITSRALERWGSTAGIVARQFYRMRFARIAPCLLAFIALQSILQLGGVTPFASGARPGELPSAIFSALTFHLNWFEARHGYLPGAWDVLWSLSVEEAFYLGFPLACAFIESERALLAVFAVFVVLGPLARVVFTQNEIWQDYAYLACMDSIAMGCAVAVLARRFSAAASNRKSWLLLAAGVIGFVAVICFRRTVFQLGLPRAGLDTTLLGLGTAAILWALRWRPSWDAGARLPGLRVLRWFGRNSYEVYLLHMFVVLPLTWVFKRWGRPTAAIIPLYLAAAILTGIGAAAIARYFSEPLNRRLRAGTSPAQTAPTVAP